MENLQCFAFKHHDDSVRRVSSSGGAFSALAEAIISDGGVVYGAFLDDDDLTLRHIRVDRIDDLAKLRGSKYLQSSVGDTFRQAQEDLSQGKTVLYCGTPCQIAGLKRAVKDKKGMLYTCDLICHGVTSPLIWKEFVAYKERQLGSRIIGASFRDKTQHPWSECKEVVFTKQGRDNGIDAHSADEYAQIFYGHEAMRPSCYRCRFTNLNRPGDLTLGDFWGVEKAMPEIYDELGVSFVLQNSKRGAELIQILTQKGMIIPAELSETRQPQLYKPVRKPFSRKWFWNTYKTKGLDKVIQDNRNPHSLINLSRNTVSGGKKLLRRLLRR